MTPRHRFGAGFTLVELLTVLAVVGLIAALLLPFAGEARHRVNSAFCLNNLKQWGIATHLYAGDHRGFLPPEGVPNPTPTHTNTGWYVQLPRVMGIPPYHAMRWRTNAGAAHPRTVWLCPSNRRRSNGLNLFHYCLNQFVNGTGGFNTPRRIHSFAAPDAVIWLFDSKNLPAVGGWTYVHTNLHSGGAQLLFVDGHAARFPRSAYRDPIGNTPRFDHPQLRWIP